MAQAAARDLSAETGEGSVDLHSGQARTTQSWEAADLRARVTELEKSNADLKAQAARLGRKTISPVVAALMGKSGIEGEQLDPAVLNKTLSALSVEQRVAVKSELARAGMIE